MHDKSKPTFQEKFRSKPENAAKAEAAAAAARTAGRIERSKQVYAKLHVTQIVTLAGLRDAATIGLFVILLGESYISRGKPFELPTRALMQFKGLQHRTKLRAKLRRLEQAGLISIIVPGAPKPMLIRVPLAL
jgi:hypothetical protein